MVHRRTTNAAAVVMSTRKLGRAELDRVAQRRLGIPGPGRPRRRARRRHLGPRLRELARPPVMILDDFGMRELTARQADDLYELINERAGRSLVLTSNRSPVDWYPLFPNAVVAESLLDRLINTSHQVS